MVSVLEIQTGSGSRLLTVEELERRARRGRVLVDQLVEADADATHVTFESADGAYRASIPLEVARRQGVLVLGEGGGMRLVVEDGETLCWNVKDLGRVRLTVGKEPDSVPDDPPH